MALLLKKSKSILMTRQLFCFPWAKGFSTSTSPSPSERNEDEVKAMFESFIAEYEKRYDTPEEKEKRFKIFTDKIRFIDHHNSTHPFPFDKVGINHLADVSIEEICGGLVPDCMEYQTWTPPLTQPPEAEEQGSVLYSDERTYDELKDMFKSLSEIRYNTPTHSMGPLTKPEEEGC
ncbi:hypothetical protein L1987_21588 [Smallanthus sonchifolius]|uniref:Uncharacterized protein n=1 Tax=Smallanthus sonchifolius TaxID=185202 RepID=A0ACB9IWI1_9ASTR|nr:hypothetical protein L1987_21588 [Smallanthus sonchifolius]